MFLKKERGNELKLEILTGLPASKKSTYALANRQLRQIHVGLDAWGLQAASINDIADIIRSDS